MAAGRPRLQAPPRDASSPTTRRPSRRCRRSPGHHAEWIDACKTGSPTGTSFDYAGPLTELVLLGNVVLCAGRKIEWDCANRCVTNGSIDDLFIHRDNQLPGTDPSSSSNDDPVGTQDTNRVADDSDTIFTTIPADWETNGAPDTLPDGNQVPDLAVGPDVDAFLRTFDDAGIRFVVFDTSDLGLDQGVDANLDFFLTLPNSKNFAYSDCEAHDRLAYSTGDLSGIVQLLDCSGDAIVSVYALAPADGSYLVLIESQTVTNEDIDIVLAAIDDLNILI